MREKEPAKKAITVKLLFNDKGEHATDLIKKSLETFVKSELVKQKVTDTFAYHFGHPVSWFR